MKKEILSPSYRLILILLLLNVSYWFFLGEFGLRAFFLMISGLYFRGIESFSARRFSLLTGSPRMVLASYGNLFFLIILGLFVLSYLLKNRKRTNISYIFFMFFGGVLISMSYLSLFIESLSRIDFTRFATFGYPFILISGAYAISKNKHKRTMAILISGFILLQVFTIPSYLYDVTACPEYRFGGYREYYLPQEYSAVGWSSLLGKVAGDWSSFELFGGLGQMQVNYESDKVAKVFEGNIPLLSSYDWFIFRREDFNSARVGTSKPVVVTVETYSKFNHAVFLGRVYDNGEVEIYRSSPEFDGFP